MGWLEKLADNSPEERNFQRLEQFRQFTRNPPSFHAHINSAQSYANAAIVLFDQDAGSESWDTHGWYNPATGTFTPQLAGIYHFWWALRGNVALTADNFLISILQKNAASGLLGQAYHQRGIVAVPNTVGSGSMRANGSTDNFRIQIQHNNGGTLALQNFFGSNFFGAVWRRPLP